MKEEETTKQPENPLASLLESLAAVPALVETLKGITQRLDQIETAVKSSPKPREGENAGGWIDATKAAVYLDMSKTTFDNYRYKIEPRITGYKVGGKTLYKREDLDRWVKLFEIKNRGFA